MRLLEGRPQRLRLILTAIITLTLQRNSGVLFFLANQYINRFSWCWIPCLDSPFQRHGGNLQTVHKWDGMSSLGKIDTWSPMYSMFWDLFFSGLHCTRLRDGFDEASSAWCGMHSNMENGTMNYSMVKFYNSDQLHNGPSVDMRGEISSARIREIPEARMVHAVTQVLWGNSSNRFLTFLKSQNKVKTK